MSRIHNSVQHRKLSSKWLQGKNRIELPYIPDLIGHICRFIGYRRLLLLHLIVFKSLVSDQVYQISSVSRSFILCQMYSIILTLSCIIPTDCNYISLSFLIFQNMLIGHQKAILAAADITHDCCKKLRASDEREFCVIFHMGFILGYIMESNIFQWHH